MDLNNLEIFVAVVEHQSLTKAANKLDMPKSKVSRRLAQLEQEHAAPLLIRTTRKLVLTESGRLLFERAEPLLKELSLVSEELNKNQQSAVGTLKLQIPIDFFPKQLARISADFLRKYPEVRLKFNHYNGIYPRNTDNADVTFVLHHQPLPDSDFIAKPMLSLRQSLYGATHRYEKDYLLNHNLSDQECLLGPDENLWFFRKQSGLEAIPVNGRIQLPNQQMTVDTCIAGMGIAKLTDVDVEAAVEDGLIRRLDTHFPVNAQTLTLLYRNKYLPKRVRLFIDFFQSHLGLSLIHI